MLSPVDLATGKAKVYYYLDTNHLLGAKVNQRWRDENLFVPAQFVEHDDSGGGTKLLVDGEVVTVRSESLIKVTPQDKQGLPDILSLDNFSEQSLLHTLRLRFQKESVYTWVGPILIAINPYRWTPELYTAEKSLAYHRGETSASEGNGKSGGKATLEPHLFAVADAAYNALISGGEGGKPKNQSVIISGESGAGKTEATKIIMQHLARITATSRNHKRLARSGSASPPSGADPALHAAAAAAASSSSPVVQIEDRVLSTNPLLEAFGNARTIRNDNSSRFGKFIAIQFANTGCIVGAKINNYLLEKTRIVHQPFGERNFHVFYQLIEAAAAQGQEVTAGAAAAAAEGAGAESSEPIDAVEVCGEVLATLKSGPEAFNYTNQSGDWVIEDRDDLEDWRVTSSCLRSIGVAPAQSREIARLLGAVLQLGNVDLVACQALAEEQEAGGGSHGAWGSSADAGNGGGAGGGGGAATPPAPFAVTTEVAAAAALLRVDPLGLLKALTLKKLLLPGSKSNAAQQSVITKTLDPGQGTELRDTLAKAVYSNLFVWLVSILNATIAHNDDSASSSSSPSAAATAGQQQQQQQGGGTGGSSPNRRRGSSSAVSSSAATTSTVWGHIGVLDIYGFENFDTNGFEQLLINYANEKLQRQFNRTVFEVEQEEYTREGVDWQYIEFRDNQATIDLIEAHPEGVLTAMDAFSSGVGSESSVGESDLKFIAQLHKWFGLDAAATAATPAAGGAGADGTRARSSSSSTTLTEQAAMAPGSVMFAVKGCSHPSYFKPKVNPSNEFGINHYAGRCMYDKDGGGFCCKNTENMAPELLDLVASSESTELREMFALAKEQQAAAAAASGGGGGSGGSSSSGGGGSRKEKSKSRGRRLSAESKRSNKLTGVSVGSQFKASLRRLVESIDATSPSYVRCIKPNGFKQAGLFASAEVLKQLKYSGMMETIRIRQQGFGLRVDHAQFMAKFGPLHPSAKALPQLVDVLSERMGVDKRDWQIGHSKVFLRQGLSRKLESLVAVRLRLSARVIQAAWALCLRRRRAVVLQAWLRRVGAQALLRRALRAAVTVQSWARARACQAWFAQVLKVGLVAQRLVRGFLGRLKFAALSDPYRGLSVEELSALVAQCEADLAAATSNRDFAACQELDAKLQGLAARRRAELERAPTLPRRELERLVLAAKLELDSCVAGKEFARAQELTAVHDALVERRAQCPTLAELEALCEGKRAAVDVAAARKDFGACAELQQELEALEERKTKQALEEGSGGGGGGATSLEELHKAKAAKQAELEAAVAARNFAACGPLNDALTALDARIAAVPTREALQQSLAQREASLAEASSAAAAAPPSGDRSALFHKQASLALEVEDLRRQLGLQKVQPGDDAAGTSGSGNNSQALTQPAQQPPEFASRQALESEIASVSKAMKEAMSAKQFSKCATSQERLDRLEALRADFPTAAELDAKAAALQKKLSAAMASKDFTTCATVQAELDAILLERKALPPSTNPPSAPTTAPKLHTPAKLPVQIKASKPAPKVVGAVAPKTGKNNAPRTASAVSGNSMTGTKKTGSTVAKLRPKAPVVLSSSSPILEVSKAMAAGRTDSVLLTGGDGVLAGIVTSTDIMRKVVAVDKSPFDPVSDVMTKNPKCVRMDDDATEALVMMMDNHFRHLPVLDSEGGIVAVLDIAKCMHDAITKIEKLEAMGKKVGSSGANDAMKSLSSGMKGVKGMNSQQAMMMQAMLVSMFGGSSSDMNGILSKRDFKDIVRLDVSVRDAAKHMATIRKGVAVADESGALVGIFTLKDLNNRVVAKELSPDTTLVSEVMTPNPESVSPDLSLLDALHLMHDQKYQHLPVVSTQEEVHGLVDAMDVMNETMGDGESSDGWRSFWEKTMEVGDDDASDTASVRSGASSRRELRQMDSGQPRLHVASAARPLRLKSMDEQESETGSQDLNGLDTDSMFMTRNAAPGLDLPFTFKVLDPNGNLHKVNASADRRAPLEKILSDRLKCRPEHLRLTYKDDDGDDIAVSDDASLSEAVDAARSNGDIFLRLRAEIDESELPGVQPPPPPPPQSSALTTVNPSPQRHSDVANRPSAPASSDQKDSSSSTGALDFVSNNPVVAAGGVAVLAGLVVAVMVVFKQERY